MEVKCFQVQVTINSEAKVRDLLKAVMNERLTVSAKIIGPVISASWDGAMLENADSWIIFAMVTKGRVNDLIRRIREIHADDSAEIVALPVVSGNGQFFSWMMDRSW